MKRLLDYRILFLFLMFMAGSLKANPVSGEAIGPHLLYTILSAVVLGLLFLTWFLFKRRQRKSSQLISDLEIKTEKTEKSIEEIKQHAEDIVSRKKAMLSLEAVDLEKNLKSMQATLSLAHESAQRNSILLSNISHTLRTNLNDILGFSYLLGNDFAKIENAELYEFTENIRKSGESLMHLLNNIIDISRIEANTFNLGMQNCNLNNLIEVLKAAYEPAAKQKGLQLFFQNEDLPLFSTDVEALQHILSNLLDNAIKYTDSGYIKVIMKEENERVVIAVKDTGIGIDAAYQDEKIFEPFRRQSLGYSKTTYQGAGLGLPLVKQMLELMEGNIKLESKKTSGTTVTISIPLSKPVAESLISSTRSRSKEKKAEHLLNHSVNKVLVIDNDNLNNMLIRKMLPKVPHLIFATSRKELDMIIENNGKTSDPFDIVILNIDFIEASGGINLRKELQNDNPAFMKTPFVALSDIADISLEDRMLQAGFKTYIGKPINKEKLFNIMNISINQ
jgi:signal transduction histidine kinase